MKGTHRVDDAVHEVHYRRRAYSHAETLSEAQESASGERGQDDRVLHPRERLGCLPRCLEEELDPEEKHERGREDGGNVREKEARGEEQRGREQDHEPKLEASTLCTGNVDGVRVLLRRIRMVYAEVGGPTRILGTVPTTPANMLAAPCPVNMGFQRGNCVRRASLPNNSWFMLYETSRVNARVGT